VTTVEFGVAWFPPDAEIRERTFKAEKDARSFIAHGKRDDYWVRDWNPVLVERTTTVVERMLNPNGPHA
jgi:hypothetical protein